MSVWKKVPFSELPIESRDGEWGEGHEIVGHQLCEIIRGTDFAALNSPIVELPQRWIPDRLVDRKRLMAGDIVFEMAGGTAKQSTGRSALLRGSFFQRHSEYPVLCASFCRHLRLDLERYSPEFIYYLLQALYAAGYMAVFNIQHTGVSRFQYTSFKKQTVLDVPGLPIQKKIAATLSAYDDLIENNRRRIALLEKMAEEIYREWFMRMRFPGHEQAKFEKGIPIGWHLVKLEKAFEYHGGGTPSKDVPRYWKDGTVNWFTPSDITAAEGLFLESSGEQCTEEALSSSSARLFPAYSVMMTSRATIGAIGINVTPACTNQGFITCIPNEVYPLSYLYHWLKLSKPHFELLSGGATFAELTKGTFRRIEILTPPKKVVEDFDRRVSPLFRMMQMLLKGNVKLKKSRDMLLPRLISGKLPVESLDIHFPPSMQDDAAHQPAPKRHGRKAEAAA